jgi:hypothetical protein
MKKILQKNKKQIEKAIEKNPELGENPDIKLLLQKTDEVLEKTDAFLKKKKVSLDEYVKLTHEIGDLMEYFSKKYGIGDPEKARKLKTVRVVKKEKKGYVDLSNISEEDIERIAKELKEKE